MNNSNQLTRDNVMLTLAFLADAESGKYVKLNRHKTEVECRKIINMALQESEIFSKIGKWNCLNVWILNGGGESRNTTMVFENEDKTELVIGVAGTNFVNRYDWFTEDVKTAKLVPWNDGIVHRLNLDTDHFKGYVSEGTAIALKNTWNLKDTIYKGVKLYQWLKEHLVENDGIESISVTGHSLGGAISPVLAQALSDHKYQWINNDEVALASYMYAGPTPGNTEFVKFVQQGDVELHSLYNTKDVVPHAWNPEMISLIPNLYMPYLPSSDSKYGGIVHAMVEWIKDKSQSAFRDGNLYVRWDHEQTFTAKVPTKEINENTIIEFVNVLKFDLDLNKESRESLCRICAIAVVDKKEQIKELTPYLEYFAKFLLVLGDEHVQAYFDEINDVGFVKVLKEYIGGGSMKVFGMSVLNELFKEIGAKATVTEIG